MSHERNRGKIFFSLEKVFQKLENVTLSVFNNCMLAPNTENSIKGLLHYFSTFFGHIPDKQIFMRKTDC